jgi:hypothetical protein
MPRSLTNDSLDTPAGLTISEIKPRVISLRVQRLTEVTLPVRVCRCLTGGAGGASMVFGIRARTSLQLCRAVLHAMPSHDPWGASLPVSIHSVCRCASDPGPRE